MDQPEKTKQRNAGRDLMPIIVIFGFAIVMTFVTIAVSSYFKKPAPAAKVEMELENQIANGEKAFAAQDWDKAKSAYMEAIKNLDQRKQENPETLLLRVELYSRLAETAVKRQDLKSAESCSAKMKQYRAELNRHMDAMEAGIEAKTRAAGAVETVEKVEKRGQK